MIRVRSTREGLVGHETATGHVIQLDDWFCALPSVKALHRTVRIYLDSNVHEIAGSLVPNAPGFTAPVLDVGPWNEHDDAYVFQGSRPMAESGLDTRNRKTNLAGIDLSDLLFRALDNPEWVYWEFAL